MRQHKINKREEIITVMQTIRFARQVPVSLALEELEVIIRCLHRGDGLDDGLNRVIANQLDHRLTDIRNDMLRSK